MHDEFIAQCAQLAMLLEASCGVKPGNVDRMQDYPGTSLYHFVASAVGAYPVLRRAAASRGGVGNLIRGAVEESMKWQDGGNTHFGTFLLLIPLCMAAGEVNEKSDSPLFPLLLRDVAGRIVRSTNVIDAIEFYEAFGISSVRVKEVPSLDMRDRETADEIVSRDIQLITLMEMSAEYDMIAREWVYAFPITFEVAEQLIQSQEPNVSDRITLAFLRVLASYGDTFIEIKHGKDVAEWAKEMAAEVLEGMKKGDNISTIMDDIEALDEEFLRKEINPGSVADIIAAGTFVALLRGMRI